MLRVLGIDFGTSTTYMNVKRYDGTIPLGDKFLYHSVKFNNGAREGSVETVVQEYSDGSFRCGGAVDQDAEIEGAVIHREFKMDLENPDENKRKSAKRSTEQFFSYLYSEYNQQSSDCGEANDEIETIISYPVKWKEDTRRFMVKAAQKAGFKNVKGIDEARAAVFSVLCRQIESIIKEGILSKNKPGYIMLIDMGAGTTDIVICKYDFANNSKATIDSLNIEMVACWPIDSDAPTFGGREMDKMLAKYVEDYLKGALPSGMEAIAANLANAKGAAKEWKEKTVSAKLEKNEDVVSCAYITGNPIMISMLKQKFPALDRSKFEALIAEGLNDFANLVNGSINAAAEKDSDFARNGLDLVVLTGGHSAWYFAKEIIDGTMKGYVDSKMLSRIRENKNRVIRLTNPQATVSYGLVYSKLPFHIDTMKKSTSNEIGKSDGELDTKVIDKSVPAVSDNELIVARPPHISQIKNGAYFREKLKQENISKREELQLDLEILDYREKCYGIAEEVTKYFNFDKYLDNNDKMDSYHNLAFVKNRHHPSNNNIGPILRIKYDYPNSVCFAYGRKLIISQTAIYAESSWRDSNANIPWMYFVDAKISQGGLKKDVPIINFETKYKPVYQYADSDCNNQMLFDYLTELQSKLKAAGL